MSLDVKENFINISGSSIFHSFSYRNENKRSIVLLHGWSFTSQNWKDVGAFEKFDKLSMNVYAFDYPGFGKSPSSPTYGINRGDLKNGPIMLRDYMHAIGLDHAHVLGASMGGGMVLKAALSFPDLIDSVVAVAPAWLDPEKENLVDIKAPVLLVWGENDIVVPPSLGKEYSHLIKDCKLVIVHNSKHPVYIDQTDQFFKIVNDFYSEQFGKKASL